MLARFSQAQYVESHSPLFLGTLGAHYRHLIEHYDCFLQQVSSGSVCFDSRARDNQLETNIECAFSRLTESRRMLEQLGNVDVELSITVKDQQSGKPIRSSIGRELLFLQAHTVHHYAIVAAMARRLNVAVDENFGLAVATQSFARQVRNAELK